MKQDKLRLIYNALVDAEKKLLSSRRDRPIDPIRQAVDQLREAQKLVLEEMDHEEIVLKKVS